MNAHWHEWFYNEIFWLWIRSHAVFTRFVIDMDVFNNDTYDSFSLFNNALYKLIVFCID